MMDEQRRQHLVKLSGRGTESRILLDSLRPWLESRRETLLLRAAEEARTTEQLACILVTLGCYREMISDLERDIRDGAEAAATLMEDE